ncbi:MAG: UbiA family prenyltransferase [Acidobacteria bacterium]|nr:UbiA family prenyltransferase [Acidobacteriota bacterium]
MIKFQHTVFALPFALLAAFTVAGGIPPLMKLAWILVAMVGARSAAMAFNRLVDAPIDAANPRTASRAIPAGLVSRSFVAFFTIVSIALFVFACWKLNRLALILAGPTLVVLLGYSFTKRFTSLSHLVLGLALGIAPIGAAVAIEGVFNLKVLPLSASVMLWTAGFDILYSMQDLDFDRSKGLFSLPSRLGGERAFLLARIFHLLALAGFVSFGLLFGFGAIYWVGIAAAAGLLLWQHSIVSPKDISRIDAAFFTANGILAAVVFLCGAADLIMRGR